MGLFDRFDINFFLQMPYMYNTCISRYFLTDLTSMFSFRCPPRIVPAFRGTFWQIWHELFPTKAIRITCISWDFFDRFDINFSLKKPSILPAFRDGIFWLIFPLKNSICCYNSLRSTLFSLRSNLVAAPLDKILFTLFWPLHKEIIDFRMWA